MNRKKWTEDEIVVLCALFSLMEFSAGDDAREECREIAQVFGRSPAAIDMQWRNINACLSGDADRHIGSEFRYWADVLLHDVTIVRRLATYYCERNGWHLLTQFRAEIERVNH